MSIPPTMGVYETFASICHTQMKCTSHRPPQLNQIEKFKSKSINCDIRKPITTR